MSEVIIKTVASERKELALELVRKLMLRGIHLASELQKHLENNNPPIVVTVRTVERYKAILTKRTNRAIQEKQGLNQTVEEIAYKLKQSIDEVLRELWTQYHSPVVMQVKCVDCVHCKTNGTMITVRSQMGAIVKVAALKEIRMANQDWVKLMQSMGLVKVIPQQHQLLDKDGKPTDPLAAQVINNMELSNDFTQWFKAKYQLPVGTAADIAHEESKKDPN